MELFQSVLNHRVFLSDPSISGIIKGYVPAPVILQNNSMLYLSLGIVGATVMPHDLYLGSSISQTRE
ncbi:divalent metal cation transporter, partial [Clostridioides difficile]|uniref:divalent metal cation transporter n=1 Tax=Clostridioides difficile TaxID=1496 RepID=UPI00235853A3